MCHIEQEMRGVNVMIIQRATGFGRTCHVSKLRQYKNIGFYRILSTPRYIAIIPRNGARVTGLHEVILQEELKEPLYKQQMRIQMGMKPKAIIHRRPYRVQELGLEEVNNKLFEIYETV